MKRFYIKYKAYVIIFLLSLVVAILSHGFFLFEWSDGRFMTGIGDGVSQMLPFKQLLYNQYTSGNFFYSNQFGMGGGTYSQLGYYYSTSIFFICSVIFTFVLETIGIIDKPDLFYWANAIIPISLIRMTLIIFVTTLYFRYMKLNLSPAFIGAVIYGTSVIYFRHVTYWEFFADAMLWLPILLYGIEKIVREKQLAWFIFAIAINLFDNFYFSYINILLASIYITFRWLFPLGIDETKITTQIKLYVYGGIAGLGISAVSFVPAVYSYLNNHRIPYEAVIPILGTVDNPLVDGRVIVIPAFVIICLFIFPLYQKRLFRFFASVTIFSIVIHFSPFIGSIFNGISAPQYRWEYFLALAVGGVVAVGLQHIHMIERRNIVIAIISTVILYLIAYYVDPFLPFPNWQSAYLVYAAIATCIVFLSLIWRNNRRSTLFISVFLIVVSLYTSNIYQGTKLSITGDVQQSSLEWMQSDDYIGIDQREIIREIQANETDEFYRIDWMVPTRNNTPIVQQFNGFSAYSSILNKELLYFYLYDLEIDMGRESVSRYGTLGNRANLASLLSGKYYIANKDDMNIPYGFEAVYTAGNYIAYENTYILPFVRAMQTVYSEADLAEQVPLVKERAMLDGIVLKGEHDAVTSVPMPGEMQRQFTTLHVGADFIGDILDVIEPIGGIDLQMQQVDGTADFYVSFTLKRLDIDEGYKLSVNEYETTRKKNSSIYKTGVDKLTIRIAASDMVSIRLPEGKYELTDLAVYTEDYETLHAAKESADDIPFTWEQNQVRLTYDNQVSDRYLSLPIPFEKGWKLTVNGEKKQVLEANYGFIGIGLQGGENEIALTYYPPYFFQTLVISLLSLVVGVWGTRRKRKELYN